MQYRNLMVQFKNVVIEHVNHQGAALATKLGIMNMTQLPALLSVYPLIMQCDWILNWRKY